MPNAEDKDWIHMFRSQVDFFPLRPEVEKIHPGDIAHHLARICRYTGGVSGFYSVAEHCVGVLLRVRDEKLDPAQRLNCERWALLHDATEAYIADVSGPLKRSPEMAAYRIAENRLADAIATRFELSPICPGIVKRVDKEILTEEILTFCAPSQKWLDCLPVPLPVARGDLVGYFPEMARLLWMHYFEDLFPSWTVRASGSVTA